MALATKRPAARSDGPHHSGLWTFPDPVNEVSARLVASGVVAMSAAAVIGRQGWLVALIAYGFVARVLTGPSLSPLGQLVTRVVTPAIGVEPRPVPGPPKRFAQGIGALFSVSAAVLWLGFGLVGAGQLVLTALIVAASLEAFAGYCLGCKAFALLMRAGVIPEAVCPECSDLSLRGPVSPSRGG